MADLAPHLEILSPDLLPALVRAWSDPAPAVRAAARLLARADFSTAGWPGAEAALSAACGLAWEAGVSPPLAAASARLDLGALPPQGVMLRADPVHLRADPARLVLFDAPTIALAADEADQLIAHLNAHFAADGVRLERGRSPQRWYLAWPQAPAAPGASPRSLRGVPLEPDEATRQGLGELRRVLTEMQMVLHDCPANHARLAAGKPPVNSVWPWGWGELRRSAQPAPGAVVGADADADVLAACLGAHHEPDPTRLGAALAASTGDVVAILGGGDAAPDDANWAALEAAATALRDGRLATVALTTAHGRFVLGRRALRRWWRRPAPFVARWQAQLAAAAP